MRQTAGLYNGEQMYFSPAFWLLLLYTVVWSCKHVHSSNGFGCNICKKGKLQFIHILINIPGQSIINKHLLTPGKVIFEIVIHCIVVVEFSSITKFSLKWHHRILGTIASKLIDEHSGISVGHTNLITSFTELFSQKVKGVAVVETQAETQVAQKNFLG